MHWLTQKRSKKVKVGVKEVDKWKWEQAFLCLHTDGDGWERDRNEKNEETVAHRSASIKRFLWLLYSNIKDGLKRHWNAQSFQCVCFRACVCMCVIFLPCKIHFANKYCIVRTYCSSSSPKLRFHNIRSAFLGFRSKMWIEFSWSLESDLTWLCQWFDLMSDLGNRN